MILGVDGGVVALVALALMLGATVQALVGLGLGLVAAPVVTIVDPSLMPELLLVMVAVLPLLTLIRSHEEIDWRGLAWVLPARVPGIAVGVFFLAYFSERYIGVAVALMVLLAVALSLTPLEVPVRPTTLVTTGFISGVAGTATSIGGPPVALLYQHRSPAQIRNTLAVLFTVGGAMSLVGIWLGWTLRDPGAPAGAPAHSLPGAGRVDGRAPERAGAGRSDPVRRTGGVRGFGAGVAPPDSCPVGPELTRGSLDR